MKRFFCLLGFSYFISMFVSSYLPESFYPYISGGAFLVGVILIFTKKFKTVSVSLITCSVAVLINFLNYKSNILPVQALDKKDFLVSGEVIDLPYKKNNTYHYDLKIKSLNGEEVKPFKTKVYSVSPLELNHLDTFVGHVWFHLPENSDSFDWIQYYKSKNVYILGSAISFLPYEVEPTSDNFSINKIIFDLRKRMLSIPRSVFSEKLANVMNGFFLGEKHNFPLDVKNNFDRIGIYHLIATSGIHISLLSSFLLFILERLRINKRISAILSSLLIILFMALTGFSPSVMRSGIMFIICSLGTVFFRKSDSLNNLGFSVLLICLSSPGAALDISLWMSVLASLGILTLREKIYYYLTSKIGEKSKNKFLNYLLSSMSVSISVSIFSFPMAAWFYKKFSLLFVISNLIFIPLSTILLNSITIFQFLKLFSIPNMLTMPVGYVCGITTKLIIFISEILAKIPFAMISLNYGYVKLSISFIIILLSISLMLKNYTKALKLSLSVSVVILFSGFLSYLAFNYNVTRVAIINCYKGSAIVISRGFKQAAVVYYENSLEYSPFNEYTFRQSLFKKDYLAILSDAESSKNINEVISNYNPENILIPRSSDLKNRPNTFYFNNTFSSKLWSNIEIETIKSEDDHLFAMINILDTKFIICLDGGDAQKLPKNYKECDFFIASCLPINYQEINTKNFIISAQNEASEIFEAKLANTNIKTFQASFGSNVYIDINENNKYLIRRFQ